MPTENRSSNTELKKIVTEALGAMVSGVTGTRPPADAPLPYFIQGPVDQAAERIGALLAQPAAQHQGEPVLQWSDDGAWWVDATPSEIASARAEGFSTRTLYSYPPSSDGYSAEDIACHAANGFRNGQAAAEVDKRLLAEAMAKAIYEQWQGQPGFVEWMDGGNSDKQQDARKIARRVIAESSPA